MRKIAAVTFDLWDTLIQELPGGADRVARLRTDRIGSFLNSKGIVHSASEIESAYRKTGAFLELTWGKRRDLPVIDQVLFLLSSVDDKLASKLGRKDIAEIERIYSESILDNPPVLLPQVVETLRSVRDSGFRTGLISNTGRTPGSVLRTMMDSMGILEFFDTTTFSNETLIRKPSEGVFRITLERLKAVPKAAVHIGDDSESDVVGAKKVGMHAIHVVAPGRIPSKAADGHVRSLSQVLGVIEEL